MPGILSPSTSNLSVGKGFLLFKDDNDTEFRHLGNCPKMIYSPQVTTLPHFSSMAGTKIQDFSIILQKGGSIAVDMEEMTAANLALFFLGTVDSSDPEAVTVGIFDQLDQIQGNLQFYATNDVGPRYYFDFTRVLISPTGQFNPISEEYNVMTVTMQHVAADDGLFGTITKKPDISTLAPENILLPFITGPLQEGAVPAYAQVGETMTANVGAWIGAQGYAYQWYADATEISGADQSTFVPTVSEEGMALTVQVTASNTIGSTNAVSSATQAVHP